MQSTLYVFLILSVSLVYSYPMDPNYCCWQFHSPALPSFTLPPPQPYSPGDITLNNNNPIVRGDGEAIQYGKSLNSRQSFNKHLGCNGDEFYYQLDNGTFTSHYVDANNVTQDVIDVFYATGKQLEEGCY